MCACLPVPLYFTSCLLVWLYFPSCLPVSPLPGLSSLPTCLTAFTSLLLICLPLNFLVCPFVLLPWNFPVCLCTFFFSLVVYLPACLANSIPAYPPLYSLSCLLPCITISLSYCLPRYLTTFLSACLPAFRLPGLLFNPSVRCAFVWVSLWRPYLHTVPIFPLRAYVCVHIHSSPSFEDKETQRWTA